MSERIVYCNGQYLPESQARVSIYDSSLVLGDMAYEVTRTVAGQPFRLAEHLDRLFHTLGALRIEPGLAREELAEITLETVRRNLPLEAADVDWNVIHNISRGPAAAFRDAFAPADRRPTVIVSCYPLLWKLAALAPAYEHGIDLVVPRQRSLPGQLLDDTLKTRSRLHYQLANLGADELRAGAWAAMLDPAGHLTEGTSGNLFVVRGGRLLTPRVGNLLPGITRHLVLELAAREGIAAAEEDLTPRVAETADELFMTATSVGVLFARSFNRVAIGDGRPGPVTTRLAQALSAVVGVDFAAQARQYARRLSAAAPPGNAASEP